MKVRDRRGGNWFWLQNEVIDRFAAEMKPMALACYVYLCRRANDEEEAWPAQRSIARDLGVDRSTVRSGIKQLVTLRLISVQVEKDEKGSYKSAIYTLLDPPREARGGGSMTQGGSIAKGGSLTQKKTHRTRVPPTAASPASQEAPDLIENPFGFYCWSIKAYGLEPSEQDRKQASSGLKLIRDDHGATREEMGRVVSKLVEARVNGYDRKHPKDLLLEKVRGNVTPIRPGMGSGASSATPAAGVEALRNYVHPNGGANDLRRFADLAGRFDFSSDADPDWRVMRELDDDRTLLARIRSVVRRACGASAESRGAG